MKAVKVTAIVLGVGLVLFALSCGGGQRATTDGHHDDDHEHTAATVAVGLHEWVVEPDGDDIHAGDVTFVVSNHGAAPHELVVVKTDEPADMLETHDGIVHEDDYEVVGKIENILPGESKSATFHLESGTYVLLCNIPGHYQAGMYAAFAVEDAHGNGADEHGHENDDEGDDGHHHDDEGEGHHPEK